MIPSHKQELKKILASFEGMIRYAFEKPGAFEPNELIPLLDSEEERIQQAFKKQTTVDGKMHFMGQLSAIQFMKVFMIWINGCARTEGKFGECADLLLLEGLEALIKEEQDAKKEIVQE